MGTHAEKLQQTLQSQPHLLASQREAERRVEDELKRAGVQNPEESSGSVEVRAEGRGRGAHRGDSREPAEEPGDAPASGVCACPESGLGGRVDLTV